MEALYMVNNIKINCVNYFKSDVDCLNYLLSNNGLKIKHTSNIIFDDIVKNNGDLLYIKRGTVLVKKQDDLVAELADSVKNNFTSALACDKAYGAVIVNVSKIYNNPNYYSDYVLFNELIQQYGTVKKALSAFIDGFDHTSINELRFLNAGIEEY
jgi:hypothetical protein